MPAAGQRVLVDLQAALAQAIGHVGWARQRGLPRLLLQGLAQRDGLRGDAQVVDRLLQAITRGLGLLLRSGRTQRRGRAVGQAAGGTHRALHRGLVGEPGGTERLLRQGGIHATAGKQEQADRARKRMRTERGT